VIETPHTHRTGRYERQSKGYLALIPGTLPPDPPIKFDTNLENAHRRAENALHKLDGVIEVLPEPNLFVMMYIRLEAVLSSRIEGTQSTLQDVLGAEVKLFRTEYKSDVYEVINYIAAMQLGIEKVKDGPINTSLIKDIHRVLLKDIRGSRLDPGEFRSTQNWIGPEGCSIYEASFVPPPPNQVVQHMCALDRFVNTRGDLPLLVKIGLIHAQFESIHPFRDGNGRVGRLIVTLMLYQNRVLQHPVLYLSWYFNIHRLEYYQKLQEVQNTGNWENWLVFFLGAVETVSKQAISTVKSILAMRERDRHWINENFGRSTANAHHVLDRLYVFPSISVNEVRELTSMSYDSSKILIERMVQGGLLVEHTGYARNRRFLLYKYVELFDAD